MRPRNGFNLSTIRNRFQHFLLLKFPHALNNFIKFLFAALVHFYSVLLWGNKLFCSSQWFIHGGYYKKKQSRHGWDQKSGFSLSTLRNTFQHSLLLKFNHALIIFINFFCGPGALLLRFNLREQYILFISMMHPWWIFWKEAIYSHMTPKQWF